MELGASSEELVSHLGASLVKPKPTFHPPPAVPRPGRQVPVRGGGHRHFLNHTEVVIAHWDSPRELVGTRCPGVGALAPLPACDDSLAVRREAPDNGINRLKLNYCSPNS